MGRLDRIANWVIILTGCAALVLAAQRLWPHAASPDRVYKVGEAFPKGLFDETPGARTFVAVVDSKCPACQTIIPLIREVAAKAERRRLGIALIGGSDQQEIRRYLDLRSAKYFGGPRKDLRVKAVPTLLVVDERGIVRWIRIGGIDSADVDQLADVILGA